MWPSDRRAARRGLSRWIILAVSLGVSLLVLGLFVVLLIYAGAQFAQALPTYQQQAQALVQQVQAWLEGMGFDPAGSAAVAGQTDTSPALTLTKTSWHRSATPSATASRLC